MVHVGISTEVPSKYRMKESGSGPRKLE